jgi:hypothetical protein
MKKKLVIGIAVVMVILVLVLLIGRLTDINAPRSTTTPNALSQLITTPSASPTETPTTLTNTTTQATPVVQPTEEQPYYETVMIHLEDEIEYHFFSSQCRVEHEGYGPEGQPIPFITLDEEGGYTIFKLNPADDVPEPHWIDIKCVDQSDTIIGHFKKKVFDYGYTTLIELNYVEKGSRFEIWFWLKDHK